jgi:hypothetical protein
MRRAAVISVALAILIAAVGCGGGGQQTVTVTTVIEKEGPSTQPAATTPVTPSEGGITKTFDQFQTPSRNIGCAIGTDSGARCDIAERSWTAPPKPAGCELDWGNGVEVFGGTGAFTCAGDTTLGQGPPLPYGSSDQAGPFRCTSRTQGVTCENTDTGHGFFISREQVQLF